MHLRDRRRIPAPPGGTRDASALLIVLLLAIMLLVGSLALWQANEAQESQVVVNLARVQAEFLAKGAHQLALLKARFLAQPLYDASDYAVGKNPFYPHYVGYEHLDGTAQAFSLNTTASFAPGPAFFTPREEDGGAIHDANADGSVSAEEPLVMEVHLRRFRADLTDVSAGAGQDDPLPTTAWDGFDFAVPWIPQDAIQVDSGTDDAALGLPADPYDGSFAIVDMRVLGGKDNQIHTEEAMVVNAVATVTSRTKGEDRTWTARLSRVYKMRRFLR